MSMLVIIHRIHLRGPIMILSLITEKKSDHQISFSPRHTLLPILNHGTLALLAFSLRVIQFWVHRAAEMLPVFLLLVASSQSLYAG